MELIRKEQNSFQFFDKVTFLKRSKVFYYYYYIYTFFFLHTASLTHVTSFGLMTPRPDGLRALGVKTPLRA